MQVLQFFLPLDMLPSLWWKLIWNYYFLATKKKNDSFGQSTFQIYFLLTSKTFRGDLINSLDNIDSENCLVLRGKAIA